jgi:prolyl 4-hydroxylase
MTIRKRGDDSYWFYEVDGFLSNDECDEIIKTAHRLGMHKSEIYGTSTDIVDNSSRKSFTAWLSNETNPVVSKIAELSRNLTNYPLDHQEDLQVVRYPTGGFFKPHYDCCDGGPEECQRMNNQGGPRKITILIYLNDDYTGGETVFPNINMKVEPTKGKALVFWSTTQDDEVIRNALHGGNPVQNGEKWICNKWIHPKTYK